MEKILRGALIAGGDGTRLDIGIADGRIVAIAPEIEADAPVLDVGGRLVAPASSRPTSTSTRLASSTAAARSGVTSPRPSTRWRGSSGSSRPTT